MEINLLVKSFFHISYEKRTFFNSSNHSCSLARCPADAIEGRRRVKEQLKKLGSFEYHQTSFSYTNNETREERFVGVPEQGGRDMISGQFSFAFIACAPARDMPDDTQGLHRHKRAA